MEPIDAIRSKLDNDFFKYGKKIVCKILDNRHIDGVGNMLKVTPLVYSELEERLLNTAEAITFMGDNSEDMSAMVFNSYCSNLPQVGIGNIAEIATKNYALVEEIEKDNPTASSCKIIPKTIIHSFIIPDTHGTAGNTIAAANSAIGMLENVVTKVKELIVKFF